MRLPYGRAPAAGGGKKPPFVGAHMPEAAAMALFCAVYAVLAVFHEPWFDEAQAWQIAKCASIRDILLEIPHYEGHPPLWHLLLAIPAKAGVPFELGLKTAGGVIAAANAYLLLFRSPLPRPVRLLLPFNYFVLYQYGVIVRPYGLLLLTLLLLSGVFPRRNERPRRFTLLLMLLCLTSAYGIVLAGGFALCRVRELWREKGARRFFAELISDRRTLSLGALLVLALVLMAEILPRENTWVPSAEGKNPFLLCLTVALFSFLPECLLTTGSWFSADLALLQKTLIPPAELAVMAAIGALLWGALLLLSSRRLLKWLLVPYLLFAGFSAAVYFSVHHLGIALLLLLFWLNVLFRDEDRFEPAHAFARAIRANGRDRLLLRRTALLLAAACLAVPLYWTARVSVNELRYDYGYGRSTARFLREHGLENLRILSPWNSGSGKSAAEDGGAEEAFGNIYDNGTPVPVCAYFGRNICLNLNGGRDGEAYKRHRNATEEEVLAAYALWREAGTPELLLGEPDVETLYGGSVRLDDYTPVTLIQVRMLWKDRAREGFMPVSLRSELLERYGLAPLEDRLLRRTHWRGSSAVTEEMKEAIRNGADPEEVLGPLFDAAFGTEP